MREPQLETASRARKWYTLRARLLPRTRAQISTQRLRVDAEGGCSCIIWAVILGIFICSAAKALWREVGPMQLEARSLATEPLQPNQIETKNGSPNNAGTPALRVRPRSLCRCSCACSRKGPRDRLTGKSTATRGLLFSQCTHLMVLSIFCEATPADR